MRWGSQLADQRGWDWSGGVKKTQNTRNPYLLSKIQSSKAASDPNTDVCPLQPHLRSSKQAPRVQLWGAHCQPLPPQPHSGFIHSEGWERLLGWAWFRESMARCQEGRREGRGETQQL